MRVHTTRSARLLITAMAFMGMLLLAIPAASAQDYPGGATFSTSTSTPACGDTITLTGDGFLADTDVTLTVGGQTIGTAKTDADGKFSFPWTVPCSQTGSVTVTATDGTTVLSTVLTVGSQTTSTTAYIQPTTGGGTTGGGSLPRTGSDSSIYVRIGVLLVSVGGLMVLGSRKRSRKILKA